MPSKHIITIAGRPGSGKSSSAKRVAEQLGFRHFSSGDLFRKLAKERGLDLLQANLSAEQNAELDHLVDGKLREIGATEDRLVIDSRTAWHWIPNSFKVFLDLDLVTASKRILQEDYKSRLHSERLHQDYKEYAVILKRRLESETRRYQKLYRIDPYDKSNYDLVVNTKDNSLEEVISIITKQFEEWAKKQ